MDERLTHDPILTRFRAALDEIYRARLAPVVLFGSQARREARPDSEYDVAVFLKRYPTGWTELDQLADLRVRFIDHTGGFFRRHTSSAATCRDQTPFGVRNPPRRISSMTPQAARLLDKARRLLGKADTMLRVGLNETGKLDCFES
jgi:uncharacterized protein